MKFIRKKPHIGQNVRLRVFFTKQEEYFEIYSDYDNKILLEYSKHLAYGESASDFIYGDFQDDYYALEDTTRQFEKINENIYYQKTWDSLLKIAFGIAEMHPYFLIVRQIAFNIYQKEEERIKNGELIDIHLLSRLVPIFKAIREDLFLLATECFNPEVEPNFTKLYKFISLTDNDRFKIDGNYAYGKIVSEIQAESGSLVMEDHNAPYGVVPPLSLISQGNRPLVMVDVLYPQDLIDIYRFIISQYFKNDVRFKICKSCNKYFAVVGNSKAEYCNRLIVGSTKTCRQIGAMRLYESKKLENPIQKEYTKAYKTRNARIRYGTITRGEFEGWSKEARVMRDKALAGIISEKDFFDWLSN